MSAEAPEKRPRGRPKKPEGEKAKRKSPNRLTSRGHPFLKGRPKGVWYPDAIGVVPGYPKTQEEWQVRSDRFREIADAARAAGVATRKGVPDGWAGRRAEVAAIQSLAVEQAEKAYAKMIEKDLIDLPSDDGSDEGRAEIALKVTLAIALDVTKLPKDRQAAANTILAYTRAKPAAKSEVTVAKAEDFLTALLKE